MRLGWALLALFIELPRCYAAGEGGDEAYPVYGPYIDDDGTAVPADLEFEFALAAINTARAQCSDLENFPPVTADDVTIYDDECRSRVLSGQNYITLSFDVPAATTGDVDYDSIYVVISTSEPVDDPAPTSGGKPDVGISVSAARDPSGFANDFRLVAIRKLDPETGDGNQAWTCAFTKEDGSTVDSSIGAGGGTAGVDDEDADDPLRRTKAPQVGSSFEINGRKFLAADPEVADQHFGPRRRRAQSYFPDDKTQAERDAILARLPKSYDVRNVTFEGASPAIATLPTNQGACGSCYAFGGTTAMAYRFYLASKGKLNVVPSQRMVFTCTNGCEGGSAHSVNTAMVDSYVPASSMFPYSPQVDEKDEELCGKEDVAESFQQSIRYKNAGKATDEGDDRTIQILGEEAIMQELFDNGPGYFGLLWKGFDSYPSDSTVCNGIATDRKCDKNDAAYTPKRRQALGADGKCTYENTNHAVTLIGWGTDEVGCAGMPGPIKYWIIQNSHGEGVGDCDGIGCGMYKVERGKNAFSIETRGIRVGVPLITGPDAVCPDIDTPDKFCKNGGSLKADCTCYCPPEYGFSGPTCSTCSGTCKDTNGQPVDAIALPADPMKGIPATCKCPCPDGFWTPPNLRGVSECGVAVGFWTTEQLLASGGVKPQFSSLASIGLAAEATTAPAVFNFRMSQVDSAMDLFHKGDFLVAVPTGTKPWAPETNWDANAGTANICGEKSTQDGKLVDCSTVMQGILSPWSDTEPNSMGTLSIDKEGLYDVYFVKYIGLSEFGVDKGFGKDFALLPQKLLVGPMPARRGLLTSIVLSSVAKRNRAAQQARIKAAADKKARAVAEAQAKVDAANAKKQAALEKANAPRTIFMPLILKGIRVSEFGMVEETSFKSALADVAGVVCNGTTAKSDKAAPRPYSNCTVRDAFVQRTEANRTTELADGSGIIVYATIVAKDPSVVSKGAQALAAAVDGGTIRKALATSGGQFSKNKKYLDVKPYSATVVSAAGGTKPPSPTPPPPPKSNSDGAVAANLSGASSLSATAAAPLSMGIMLVLLRLLVPCK